MPRTSIALLEQSIFAKSDAQLLGWTVWKSDTHIFCLINEDTTGGVELVVFPDTSADRWWRPEVMLTLSLSDECPSPWATV
jgi:hypothetical protein